MVDSPGESRYHTLPHERVPQIPAPYLLSLLLSCPVTRLQLFCAYSSRRGCRRLVSIRDTAAGACGAGTRRGRDVARCRRRRSRSAGADGEGAGGAGAAGGVGGARGHRGRVPPPEARHSGVGAGGATRRHWGWARRGRRGRMPPPKLDQDEAGRCVTAVPEEAAARDEAGGAARDRRTGRGRRAGRGRRRSVGPPHGMRPPRGTRPTTRSRPSAGMRRTARLSGGCTTREETGRGRVGEDSIKIKLITGPKNL